MQQLTDVIETGRVQDSRETEAVGALRNPEPSIKTEGAKATRGEGVMCGKA